MTHNPFKFTTSREVIRGHITTLLGYLASGHCSTGGLLQGCRDTKNRGIRKVIAQFLVDQKFAELHMVGPDGEDILRKGPEPITANTIDTLADLVYGASRDHARATVAAKRGTKPVTDADVRAIRRANIAKAQQALKEKREAAKAANTAEVPTIGEMVERHQAEAKTRLTGRAVKESAERVTTQTLKDANHRAILAIEKAREEVELKAFIRSKTDPKPQRTPPALQATSDRLRGIAWRLNDSQTPGEVRNLAASILEVAAELDRHGTV